MSKQDSASALLCKSSSAPECYGTLRYLIAGVDGNASPSGSPFQRVRPAAGTKYVSSIAANLAGSTDANNASTDDQHGIDEGTSLIDRTDARKDTLVTDGKKTWIDRVAAGVALVSVCIVLGGGLVYVSSRVRN